MFIINSKRFSSLLPAAFRFQVDTTITGSSGLTEFLVPIPAGTAGLSITVNWGDGNSTVLTAASPAGDFTHDYGVGNEGIYNCWIVGEVKGWAFNNGGDKNKITKITDWTDFDIIASSFRGCVNLVVTAITIPIINSAFINNSFRECTSLGSPDFSGWNTSVVTNMASAFRDCGNCGVILAGWDMNQVTNLNNFANGTKFTTTNYSNLLIDVATQGALGPASPNFGTSTYNAGAVTDRATCVTNGWTITDDGLEP